MGPARTRRGPLRSAPSHRAGTDILLPCEPCGPSVTCGGQVAVSTAISWTDETWNPVTGCSCVSEGCRHCYAEALSPRKRVACGRYGTSTWNGGVKAARPALRDLIVEALKAKGFGFRTVGALLKAGTPEAFEQCYDRRPGDNRYIEARFGEGTE